VNTHIPTVNLTESTVLVTLAGPDQSGVSTQLFQRVGDFDVDVVDIEQLVVRGRLVLSALFTVPGDSAAFERSVQEVGSMYGLTVTVEYGVGDNRPRRVGHTYITVLGSPMAPAAMGAITARINAAGGNIDRILRLARYPVTAIRLEVSGAEPETLQSALVSEGAALGVDVAVQERGILQHAQRLIVMDVDSTLIQGEVIEMIADYAGCREEVAAVTREAMAGELDFSDSLTARVKLLEGVSADDLDRVYEQIRYAPGARTMIRSLKRLGYRFALVSGGFTRIIERIADDLDIDYFAANELEVEDGRLTGRVVGRILDRTGKATALREFAEKAGISIRNTVAIGDGANDLDMLSIAGLGIAFNAKPMVRSYANTSVNVPYLDAVMYLLGITREEVEAADALDPSATFPPA